MKRIDSQGAVSGKWVDKDPATGRPGTTLQASWLNSLQEEVCSVIERAGLKLDPATTTQLYDGIQNLIQNRRKDPKVIETGQNGFFAFPRVRGLVEMGGTVQTDSSLARVSVGIFLEEFLDPTTGGGRFLTNWCFVLDDGVLPPPMQALKRTDRLRHSLSTDWVEADIFAVGTAIFRRFFEEGLPIPAGATAMSSATCLFGKVTAASVAGATPVAIVGKYCILLRLTENANTQVTDSILVDFSYYS